MRCVRLGSIREIKRNNEEKEEEPAICTIARADDNISQLL